MRSAITLVACIIALKCEVNDLFYWVSKQGLAPEELNRLSSAASLLEAAKEQLRAFRFIKKVEDLPEAENTTSNAKPKK